MALTGDERTAAARAEDDREPLQAVLRRKYFRKDRRPRSRADRARATFEEGGEIKVVAFRARLDGAARRAEGSIGGMSEGKFRDFAETASDWFWGNRSRTTNSPLLTENAFWVHTGGRSNRHGVLGITLSTFETEPEEVGGFVRATLDSRKGPFP